MKKVVIVTGASRGIGNSIAKLLSKEDYQVIANYNKSEIEAKKLKEEFGVDIFQADVSKREEVKALINYTINKYKKIDCIINNAGIDQVKMFVDITDQDWEYMIQNNLNSVFYMCQETIPYMVNRKEGSIINISSIWGQIGASCESHYAATKAAIDAITKSLAKELGDSNIRVNSIAPGVIDTEMNNNLSEEEKEDIAKCVKWLLEDEYVTGQVININGGWLI